MKFRKLKAEEIECRVSTVKQTGLSLLLYKDARCDMNILDESVGAMDWKREHTRENANCIVSLWDEKKKQWIGKEDTGTESYTEKEKGLASDSFKRACFNWGIGRELYTAPFIWVKSENTKIVTKGNGFTCYERFNVDFISYDNNGHINGISISSNRKEVYKWGNTTVTPKKETTRDEIKSMIADCKTVNDLSALKANEPTWMGENEIQKIATIKYNEITKGF